MYGIYNNSINLEFTHVSHLDFFLYFSGTFKICGYFEIFKCMYYTFTYSEYNFNEYSIMF